MRRSFASLSFVLLAIILFSACRAKPGEDCTDSPASCVDSTSHLACVKGKYVLETCKGKGGCTDDKSLVCDNTRATPGDGCGPDGARACSGDGTKELRCRDNQFAVEWSCRGGCVLDDSGNPKCTPVGEVGEVCRPESIVCDGAEKAQLHCVDGKLAAQKTCHGALGCKTAPGGSVRCDRTQAIEDEACTEEGSGACDSTKRSVLVCKGGHFKTDLQCLGPLGCELPGNYSVRCDKSIVEENEPCTVEQAPACSTDGKQVRCTDGKFIKDKKWKPKKGETCANHNPVSFETEKFEAR